MSQAEDLINSLLENEGEIDEFIDEFIGRKQRSFRKPRMRRFRGRGAAVDPVTGRRKDPRKRRRMRQVMRRFKSKFKMAAKKRARKLKARGFFKKLGKLAARVRR